MDRTQQEHHRERDDEVGPLADVAEAVGQAPGRVRGRARHELLAGLRDDLAAVVGLGLRDLGHVLRDQVTELADQRAE